MGSRVSPNRMMNARRVPAASSRSLAGCPTHSGSVGHLGQHHRPRWGRATAAGALGKERRRIWSAVQRTVATVGMPSRS